MHCFLSYFCASTSRPSSLDAVVFGYLSPLLKASLPNTKLQNHLRGCQNLCRLCTRIIEEHFPRQPDGIKASFDYVFQVQIDKSIYI